MKKLLLAALLFLPLPAFAQNQWLGNFYPGQTVYIYFPAYGASGESLTISNLAVGDILVYKDGSTTQRASTSGYALLDSDGIDFDGVTGVHGVSISLADNTTASFWQPGHEYQVVISPFTIDGQTTHYMVSFSIDNRKR